jgi:hypothetical protein
LKRRQSLILLGFCDAFAPAERSSCEEMPRSQHELLKAGIASGLAKA